MLSHLRFAARKILRSPSFAALGVLTLAIAIGANAAIFGIVDAVMLQPLPYDDADRLVFVGHTAPGLGVPQMNISDKLYVHYEQHADSFEAIGLYDRTSVSITGLEQPIEVDAAEMSPSLFEILGVRAARGRAFDAAEGRPGGEPVAVISHAYWQQRLGGEQDVVGRVLEADGRARQIVGVMPADFGFPDPDVEVWVPAVVDPETAELGSFGTQAIARLKPGVDLERAESELRTFLAMMSETFPEDRAATVLERAEFDVVLQDLGEYTVGSMGPVLWVLSATVGFVLLLAAFNVANLFLARAEERQRETALRSALGAGPTELAVTALFEGLLLSFAAAGLGLGLAHYGIRLLKTFGPQDIPRMHEVGVDARTVLFVAGLSVVIGMAFALIPIFRSRLHDLAAQLKDGGRSSSAGRQRHAMRRFLVAAQMGIAILLLIGAALMGRSYLAVADVDPGFDTDNALTFFVSLPESRVDQEQVAGVFERMLETIEAVPGVRSAGSTTSVPLTGTNSASGFRLEYQDPSEMLVVFSVNYGSTDYLSSLGVPIVAGRGLERDDWLLKKPNVVVSRALAETRWPGDDPIGKRLFPGGQMDEDDQWFEVVGVAGDVRVETLTSDPQEIVYFPWKTQFEEQQVPRGQAIVVRTETRPESLIEPIRRAVWSVDPNVPLAQIQTLDEIVDRARASSAFTALMLLIAAIVAVILGSVGTYGVIAYLVAQRTQEIGVRLALGASRRKILGMVLREGLVLSFAGAVVGLAAAFFLSRGLESVLYEVAPRDPLTFATVPILLAGVAVVACLVPARRASNTDPAVSLRHD